MAAATPSKRAAPDSSSLPPAKKGHWSQGLLSSMNDPNLLVESDDRIVIIKDKYPKARYHFLAIPKINVPNLKSLKREQSELLRYMEDQCRLLAAKYPHTEFSADVIRCLEERGMVVTMTPIAGEKLLDLPLKCHRCSYAPQNMPKLKQHLYKHMNN